MPADDSVPVPHGPAGLGPLEVLNHPETALAAIRRFENAQAPRFRDRPRHRSAPRVGPSVRPGNPSLWGHPPPLRRKPGQEQRIARRIGRSIAKTRATAQGRLSARTPRYRVFQALRSMAWHPTSALPRLNISTEQRLSRSRSPCQARFAPPTMTILHLASGSLNFAQGSSPLSKRGLITW